jgi:DNA-binding transcriptional MerR regulator
MGTDATFENWGWSSHEAARIVGISYRQIDHWDRTGVVKPTMILGHKGSGSRRRYSHTDVCKLMLVSMLVRSGYRLERVRDLLPTLDLSENLLVIWDDIGVLTTVVTGHVYEAVQAGIKQVGGSS